MDKCVKKLIKNICKLYTDIIKPKSIQMFQGLKDFTSKVMASEELKPKNIQKQAKKIKQGAQKAIKIIASDVAEISKTIIASKKQVKNKPKALVKKIK